MRTIKQNDAAVILEDRFAISVMKCSGICRACQTNCRREDHCLQTKSISERIVGEQLGQTVAVRIVYISQRIISIYDLANLRADPLVSISVQF